MIGNKFANMWTFLILCGFLWHYIAGICCKPTVDGVVDTTITLLPLIPASNPNNTKLQGININGDNHFHATHQTFYLNGPTGCKISLDSSNGRTFYVCDETAGIHARATSLKLYLQASTWDQSRKTCVEEGGHLAVIRTDEEEKIILQMMNEKSVDIAWLGLHSRFDDGLWISVFDETLDQTGWSRWSKRYSPNPATAHCATLLKNGGGMTDNECALQIPFVCKRSIS